MTKEHKTTIMFIFVLALTLFALIAHTLFELYGFVRVSEADAASESRIAIFAQSTKCGHTNSNCSNAIGPPDDQYVWFSLTDFTRDPWIEADFGREVDSQAFGMYSISQDDVYIRVYFRDDDDDFICSAVSLLPEHEAVLWSIPYCGNEPWQYVQISFLTDVQFGAAGVDALEAYIDGNRVWLPNIIKE